MKNKILLAKYVENRVVFYKVLHYIILDSEVLLFIWTERDKIPMKKIYTKRIWDALDICPYRFDSVKYGLMDFELEKERIKEGAIWVKVIVE